MTKKELEQLINLRKEIEELEQSILKIKQMDIGRVQDKVKSSSKNFPYIQGSATIEGFDKKGAERRNSLISKKEMLLTSRKAKVEQEEIRLTQYINSVPDSRIRRIMQYRYVEGYSWQYIANIMNYDKSYPEKLIAEYLKKNK